MNLLSVILVANVNIFHNFFVFVNCLGHTQIFLFVFLKRQSDSKYSPVPPVWACFPWLNWRGLTKDLERPFQLILNLDLWIKVCGPDLRLFSSYALLHDLWRRKWQPTPGFFPGKFHGQKSLVGYIVHGVRKSRTRLSDWTELNWRAVKSIWKIL